MLPPLRFHPLIKRIRWGGTRLGTLLGKPIGEVRDAAESWELVDHGADQSRVAQGPFAGITLHELLREQGTDLYGPQPVPERFPLLVKFLDAHDLLSVQVHPNDEQAVRYQPGELGKSEAWVILQAEPGARVYAGLRPGVDRQMLSEALHSGRCPECLHEFEVHPGDVVSIPAGTVHALGQGIVLAEIQQSSDLTFRLYDWGRVGADGLPRPIHIEQALECIDFDAGPVCLTNPLPISIPGVELAEELVRTPQFVLRRYRTVARDTALSAVPSSFQLPAHAGFRVIMVLAGGATVATEQGTEVLTLGETLLIPACARDIRIFPTEPLTLLEAIVPTAGRGT